MKKNRFKGRFATFFLIAGLFSVSMYSCKENDKDVVKPITITDIILKNEQFSILREIMLYAKMSDAMRTENYTLFAPDNAAFGRANIFSSSAITSLPPEDVRLYIQNHIIKNTYHAADIKVGNQQTLGKDMLKITKVDSVITINKSVIKIPDVKAANGLIQVVDLPLVELK